MKLLYGLFIYVCLFALHSNAQTREVTIHVVKNTKTIITFGSEIKESTWITCFQDPKFNAEPNDEELRISPKNKDEEEGQKCQLMVLLKDKTKLKLNVIYTKKEVDPKEYDLRSDKKINEQIKSQEGGDEKPEKKTVKKEKEKESRKVADKDEDDKEVKKSAKKEQDDEDDKESKKTNSNKGKNASKLKDFEEDESDDQGIVDVDENKAQEVDQTDEQIEFLMKTLKEDNANLKEYINKLVHNFEKYSQKIANEKKDVALAESDKKKVFKDVFNSYAEATVQIKNKTGTKPPFLVKEYLDRLTRLGYSSTQFDAKDIRIQNIRRDPDDGNWYATISFLQTFEGCTGGSKESMKKCIRSSTKKTARIQIVVNKRLNAGKEEYTWRAYITDIIANEN